MTEILSAAIYISIVPKRASVLQIGLGTGSLASYLFKKYNIRSDIVEIDDAVVKMAKKHFQFVETGKLYLLDGREMLFSCTHSYDIIFSDTFTGVTAPHLLTKEVFF